MKAVWITDVHLDALDKTEYDTFVQSVVSLSPDAVLLTGDIGTAETIADDLPHLARDFNRPLYFVLGNHDFYHGSIAEVRERVGRMVANNTRLTYLTRSEAILVTDKTALIGHDAYSDGGYGDYARSDVRLNDYLYIKELKNLGKTRRLKVMQSLAGEAADHFRRYLPVAFAKVDRAVLLMHPPPYKEACLYLGRIGGDLHLPHFSCKMVGDALIGVMRELPDKRLTVLCGHTHGGGDIQVLPNLRVLVGSSDYHTPLVELVLDL